VSAAGSEGEICARLISLIAFDDFAADDGRLLTSLAVFVYIRPFAAGNHIDYPDSHTGEAGQVFAKANQGLLRPEATSSTLIESNAGVGSIDSFRDRLHRLRLTTFLHAEPK
jgi:hypothetical protein